MEALIKAAETNCKKGQDTWTKAKSSWEAFNDYQREKDKQNNELKTEISNLPSGSPDARPVAAGKNKKKEAQANIAAIDRQMDNIQKELAEACKASAELDACVTHHCKMIGDKLGRKITESKQESNEILKALGDLLEGLSNTVGPMLVKHALDCWILNKPECDPFEKMYCEDPPGSKNWVQSNIKMSEVLQKQDSGECRLDKPEDKETQDETQKPTLAGLSSQQPTQDQAAKAEKPVEPTRPGTSKGEDPKTGKRTPGADLAGGVASRGTGLGSGGLTASGVGKTYAPERDRTWGGDGKDVGFADPGQRGYSTPGPSGTYGGDSDRLEKHGLEREKKPKPEDTVPLVPPKPEKTIFEQVEGAYAKYRSQYN
jgi:hypothetical protein